MATQTFALGVGNTDLNAVGFPKGATTITSIQLIGGAGAATVNLYDSAVSPPAVVHAATVALTESPKTTAYGYYEPNPTAGTDPNDIEFGKYTKLSTPRFNSSVIYVPPGAAPAEPSGGTATDPSNYRSSTGVYQRNAHVGKRGVSTVVGANTATVPSQGTFYVAANGNSKFDTYLTLTRGLVANATAATTLVVTYI